MKDLTLRLSMRVKDHRICVSKDVAKVLGNPAYVSLMRNREEESIAFQVCDQIHLMSYKVPKPGRQFYINSLSYTEELAERYNLDRDVRYHLEENTWRRSRLLFFI